MMILSLRHSVDSVGWQQFRVVQQLQSQGCLASTWKWILHRRIILHELKKNVYTNLLVLILWYEVTRQKMNTYPETILISSKLIISGRRRDTSSNREYISIFLIGTDLNSDIRSFRCLQVCHLPHEIETNITTCTCEWHNHTSYSFQLCSS